MRFAVNIAHTEDTGGAEIVALRLQLIAHRGHRGAEKEDSGILLATNGHGRTQISGIGLLRMRFLSKDTATSWPLCFEMTLGRTKHVFS